MNPVVAVVGASGYAGGELVRLLAAHPSLRLGPLTGASNAGMPVASVHPHLTGVVDDVLRPTTPESVEGADLVFTALPHGESAALVRALPQSIPVVDLGADFRLDGAEQWAAYYGGDHAGTWTYGLPEISGLRSAVSQSSRVANPGCYATAVALALAPLLQAELVEASDVVVVAASGTTGAGRSAKVDLLASEVMGSMSAYKVGGLHQHTPEMEQSLARAAGQPVTLSFTPLLAPMPRGIIATCTARLSAGTTDEELREALHSAYGHERFVHVLPQGRWPRTADTLGANSAHLQVAADHHAGRAVVVIAIDNLVKGAAGQAVQNANLILGLDEGAGLPIAGVAP